MADSESTTNEDITKNSDKFGELPMLLQFEVLLVLENYRKAVEEMLQLWNNNPEFNEKINIENLIPMSLEELAAEINFKVAEYQSKLFFK